MRLTKYIKAVGGIYAIINIRTSKVYVGSSNNLKIRTNDHIRRLTYNKHDNKHLQNSWNLDKEYFTVQCLQICENEDRRLELEGLWIEHFNSHNRAYGYNKDRNPSKVIMSEETKELIRRARKGTKRSKEVIEKIRIANTGQVRVGQKQLMQDRWAITKTYFGYNKLTEDKKLEVNNKISKVNLLRYENDLNVINNLFVKIVTDTDIHYFRSCVQAAKFLQVDKKTIKMNINKQIRKRNCYVYSISKEEFAASKVVGEK